MTARDALAAIRERVNHEPCCDHSGRDEHGCWDCRNTGCAHPPYAEGQATKDLAALVGALAAVLEVHRMRRAVPGLHGDVCAECLTPYPCETVQSIETALEGQ